MTTKSQGGFSPAIGRNDPCPCGSNRKYKKCCMERHAAEKAAKSSAIRQEGAAWSPSPDSMGMGIHPYAIAKFAAEASKSSSLHLSKSDVAALKDKWSIAKVDRIETGKIVSRLEELGIDGHEDAYRILAAGRSSAWSIGNEWFKAAGAPTGKGVEDFICLAACVLWKRYCPEDPSIEMIDDWVSEGYDLVEYRSDVEAVEVWSRVWEHLMPVIKPEMTTFSAVDSIFNISQFFGNWIQDFVRALRTRHYMTQSMPKQASVCPVGC